MSSYVIPTYQPPLPRVADFRAAVRKVAGDEFEGTWRRLCAEARVPPGAATMSPDQLTDLAAVITDSPGVLGIMGRSLAVRLSTHRTLTALNGASS
jgi:hypothetical protein